MSSGVDHCTKAEHAALKKSDAAWDGLVWRADWHFEDHVLEQRDCQCGSTLARKKRVIEHEGLLLGIGQALHVIRFFKGMAHGYHLRGARGDELAARHMSRKLERKMLALCMKKEKHR